MKFTAISDLGEKRNTIWVKDNQYLEGIFRGDLHEDKVHWVNKRKTPCKGEECGHCSIGLKANFNFRVNFVHKDDDGTLIASIYEGDWYTYQRLHKINESAPLENSLIKISKGLDKGYKVDLFEKIKTLNPETMKAVEGVVLNNLVNSVADYSPSDLPSVAKEEFDDIPF